MDVGSPFGSRTRTRVLLALELNGQSYPRELARLLAAPLSVVQKALRTLERDALVTGRMLGRTRLLQLNPAYVALRPLRGFLASLLQADGRLKARAAGGRLRSPRTGSLPEHQRAVGERKARVRPKERGEVGGPKERADRWRVG
ncbi:MAG TPA: winged helix-turn-helix domain-containing protein [Thermoanaerobaculia bacterium]|nr:winged helix-turn-helix domain-containing protein [Thermoanaerobaculia bacterium]